MEFIPSTEQELADRKLLPKGDYDFEILDAWEKTSEAGNPMIEVKVRVSRNGSGLARVLADYLHAKKQEKLRHCCTACGLMDEYESGSLNEDDFKGKRGRLRLVVERGRNGYASRNVIEDYLVSRT